MKYYKFIMVAILALISIGVGLGQGQMGVQAKVEPTVLEKLESQKEVSVIVILKDSSGIDYSSSQSREERFNILQEKKAHFRKVQSSVLSELSNTDFKLRHRYSTVNGFAGKITIAGLQKLKNNPNVLRIYADRKIRATLSQSVPFINADDVWIRRESGVNITGRGESVCIIDSGVDYTHPALGGCFGTGCKVIGGYDFVNDDDDPMDDNGHGTHCAGIVASTDATYTGVAPEANIVALKVLNATGYGSLSDAAAAIDWCTDNAITLNISVISMSVGDGKEHNSSTCPTTIDSYINTAYNQGILVVAASGNEYYSDGINYPACSPNVTSVGSVERANDAIPSYSNTDEILDLLAPGGTASDCTNGICSTCLGGGFCGKVGTSMATPHVAGAAALLQQYKKLESGIALTPQEIETALKTTGINVTDADNGLTFPRIDVYAALQSIDSAPPEIAIESPLNKTYGTGDLDFNITVNEPLTNALFSIDGGANQTMTNDSLFHYYNITQPTLEKGVHSATFWANDSLGNANQTTVYFTIDITPPTSPSLAPPSPDDSLVTKITTWNFNWTVTDNLDPILLCNLTINGMVNGSNIPTPNASYANYTVSGFADGGYQWNITCWDDAVNVNTSETRTFTVDTTPPPLILIKPENKTYNTQINLPLEFITDDTNDTIWYSLDGGVNVIIVGNTTFNVSSDGPHNLTLYVNDSYDNINQTTQYFAVDTTPPTITIQSPENKTYSTTSIHFNITVNEPLTNALFSIDGGANKTLVNDTLYHYYNITESVSEGFHNVTFWANDTVGKIGSNITYFGVDITAPTYRNITELNDTVELGNVQTIRINVTDINLDTVLIEYNSTNHTMQLETGDIYNHTWTPTLGVVEYKFYMNDTAGNTNSTPTYNFTVIDTTLPTIIIITPEDTTYNSTELSLNFTAIDIGGIVWCGYSLNGAPNQTLAGCTNTTITVPEGPNNITIYANDTSGNLNSSTVYFTVAILPVISTIRFLPPIGVQNQNVTITCDVSDDTNVSAVWAESVLENLTFDKNSYYWANLTNTSQVGSYDITIFANDTYGNEANATKTLEIKKPVTISITITDLEGNPADLNITIKVLNQTQNTINTTNGTGTGILANDTNYTVSLSIGSFAIQTDGVFIDQNTTLNISFEPTLTVTPPSKRYFYETNYFSPNYSYSGGSITADYSNYKYADETRLSFYRCVQWNVTCPDNNWTNISSTINTSTKTITAQISTFSAYALGEEWYCGNGRVDPDEHCGNCEADAACPTGYTCDVDTCEKVVTAGGGGRLFILPKLQFSEYPRTIELGRGDHKKIDVVITNTGAEMAYDVLLAIDGLPTNWYEIPVEEKDIGGNSNETFSFWLRIPEDAAYGEYNFTLRALRDDVISASAKSQLIISKEISEIRDNLTKAESLRVEIENYIASVAAIGANTTEANALLERANALLAEARTAYENKEYAIVKEKVEQANALLAEARTSAELARAEYEREVVEEVVEEVEEVVEEVVEEIEEEAPLPVSIKYLVILLIILFVGIGAYYGSKRY